MSTFGSLSLLSVSYWVQCWIFPYRIVFLCARAAGQKIALSYYKGRMDIILLLLKSGLKC